MAAYLKFGQIFEKESSPFLPMDPPDSPQGLRISEQDNFEFSFLNFIVWLRVVLKYAEGQKPAGGCFDSENRQIPALNPAPGLNFRASDILLLLRNSRGI